MASRRPLQSLLSSAASATPTLSAAPPAQRALVRTSARAFATTRPSQSPEHATEEAARPRWQQTPPRMTAPFRVRPKPRGPEFKVNEDPRRLDEAFTRMLGAGGDKVLSEDVKWLAVTHKSFDHGRRGFNDRLAYLGRRIVSLQTSQALLNAPQAEAWPKKSDGTPMTDAHGRIPFIHPALTSLPGLTGEAKDRVLDKARLAGLAERYGIDKVTRWKPKRTDNLQSSGLESVLTTSLYAIVGAIALERGGEIANKVTQDKILAPLGFTFTAD